jgi:hypothetical protein
MIYRRYTTAERTWTTDYWVSKRDSGGIAFPAYQRGSVWNLDLRVGLVHALYSGSPIPPIIYSVDHDGFRSVIDGRQRLETLFAWVDGSFTVPGEWFDCPGAELDFDRVSTIIGNGDIKSGRRAFSNLRFAGVEYDLETVWDAATRTATPVADQNRIEAELYLMLNAAHVAHTDDDLAVARRIVAAD